MARGPALLRPRVAQTPQNAFHTTTRAQFDRAVADLDAAIPTLDRPTIVVRLMQITASVGDGHTGIHLPASFKIYPVVLFWFGDELRVTAAEPSYAQALGGRVVKDRRDADPRRRGARAAGDFQAENDWHTLGTSAIFFSRPDILQGLGVVRDREGGTFTVQDDNGAERDVALVPISANPPPRFRTAAATPLLARQNPGVGVLVYDAPRLADPVRQFPALRRS